MDTAIEKENKVVCVQKGPVEGMIFVNGRPQVESVDMPTITFDSIQALLKLTDNNK